MNRASRKTLFFILKNLIALIVFAGIGWTLYKQWEKIAQVQWEPNYLLLILSGICYAVAYIPSAIYWRYAMQVLGQKPGIYEAFRAYYIGHLGKYVPGKAMVLIIRSGLLNHEKTKVSAAAASIFLETMTMMAVGSFIAALTALIWFRQAEHITLLTLFVVGICAGTMLPILPPVFHFAAKKCRIELHGLKFKTLAIGWMLNVPVWLMLGISLWLTMLGLGMKSESFLTELPACVLAISCSMVLGFASMIPGGLGVREWAMHGMLIQFFMVHPMGTLEAAVSAPVVVAVQRIISVLAELAVSALLTIPPLQKGEDTKSE